MHGYDLRKRMREDFGLLSSLSFGSLYPALARLQATGAVHEVAPEQRPLALPPASFTSAGSIAGERAAFRARLASRRTASSRSTSGTRGRRVYEITAHGNEVFHRLLEAEEPKSEGGRGFALRWAFAGYLSPESRISLLERRRAATTGQQGRLTPGDGVTLANAGPLPALPRRPRQGGDRARLELDRPSHRQRTGGTNLLVSAQRGAVTKPVR